MENIVTPSASISFRSYRKRDVESVATLEAISSSAPGMHSTANDNGNAEKSTSKPKKKRVTFASDDKLCQVKLFHVEETEATPSVRIFIKCENL